MAIMRLIELEQQLRIELLDRAIEGEVLDTVLEALRAVCSDEILTPRKGPLDSRSGVVITRENMLVLEVGEGFRVPLTAKYQSLCNACSRYGRELSPRRFSVTTRKDCYFIARVRDRGVDEIITEIGAPEATNSRGKKRPGRPLTMTLELVEKNSALFDAKQMVNVTGATNDEMDALCDRLTEQLAPKVFAAQPKGEGHVFKRII